ncbi:glycine cleavage system protein GcvH [Acetomicrobium sp. UBA5826]|uniref:glycine cleavage system protein GcvH n=1 Tax=Acetomicrobium sp. UBA5826 TaxID=1946039 RepID=UPI00257CDD90|nr:glycine cleavage system protein GcvH [Acetomicrobium sp. UBA5826]
MNIPENLKYTKTHEWVRVEGNKAYVGITDFAQGHLGDIVYVELPEVGSLVEAGEALCSIESVKAASDVYSPVSGEIAEVNDALEGEPGLLNEDPYENWIATIEMNNPEEVETLLDAASYAKHCEEEEEAMG